MAGTAGVSLLVGIFLYTRLETGFLPEMDEGGYVLVENDRVRVLDFHSKTGEKIPMHSHPASIAYAISGSGKTKFTSADGKTSERGGTVGAATWRDAETHASEYLGPGDIHALLVELKAKPAKAAKKKTM